MVMPANNSAKKVRWLARRYPGTMGHLYSPGAQRGPFRTFPYALDNGCFKRWNPGAFRDLLRWAHGHAQQPMWVVVPDVVGQWRETQERWMSWAPWIRKEYAFPLALAVQDDATPDQVVRLDPQPDVIFVGGSTKFKWDTCRRWCDEFPRVHVARVNSPEKLWELHAMGAESCDGTGWMRGDRVQLLGLVRFLRGRKPERFRTFFDAAPQPQPESEG